MSPCDPRLQLIERYVAGRVPAEDLAQLEQALLADGGFRALFLEYLNLDSALEACHSGTVAQPEEDILPLPASRLWSWLPALAAAAVVLLSGFIVWMVVDQPRPKRPAPQAVASQPGTGVAVEILESDSVPGFAKGQRLQLQHITIPSGWLSFRLNSGAVVQATGPAEFSLESPLHLRMHRGKLAVDVGSHGARFVIETATTKVVDIGTRFGVTVEPDRNTEVVVFEGKVKLYDADERKPKHSAIASLRVGEALRVGSEGTLSRLTAVSLKPDGLGFAADGKSRVVLDVTDNITDDSFRGFYAIVPAGMKAGAQAYSDRNHPVWQAAAGEPFPDELVGADLISPFHTDRSIKNLEVAVHLARPATVYVMHDARKPALKWLKADFIDTGWRLRCGPWPQNPFVRDLKPNEDGEVFIEYTVWRKDVPQGDSLELGPPRVPGEGGTKAMYGIAVKPLESRNLAAESPRTAGSDRSGNTPD